MFESATVKSSDNLEELVLVSSPKNEVKPNAAVTGKQDLETYDKSDGTCQQDGGSTPENVPKLRSDVITANGEELKRPNENKVEEDSGTVEPSRSNSGVVETISTLVGTDSKGATKRMSVISMETINQAYDADVEMEDDDVDEELKAEGK